MTKVAFYIPRFFCRVFLWKACIAGIGITLSSAYAVDLPSSSGTSITLQSAYPGVADFTLQPGGVITDGATPVTGNNSQNWNFINYGTLSGTNTGGVSGLLLGSLDRAATIVDNYGTITSAGTAGSNASGVRFTNGGRVYNRPGAVIYGFDGVHTDNGSIFVQNEGRITAKNQTGIYSGVGAAIYNLETGVIESPVRAVYCNGPKDCIVDNHGLISGNSTGVDLSGSAFYSLYNASTGTIVGSSAVHFEGTGSQVLNMGLIRSTGNNSTALSAISSGNTYVNGGTIIADTANGTAVHVVGNGNAIYNLGTLTGSVAAVSLTGNDNVLVLGTQATLPARDIDVTGPGSVLNGNAVSTGTGNQILLTDSGTEDSSLIGFTALTMSGQSWSLSAPLTLNGTANDTLSVNAGTLLLTSTVSTSGATTVGSGGTLRIGNANNPTATLTNPNGVIVNAGGNASLAIVDNYGTITSAGTAPAIRFVSGGSVYNRPGAVIFGFEGVRSDNGAAFVQNEGTIESPVRAVSLDGAGNQVFNTGLIRSTGNNGVALAGTSSGDVYVNAGTMIADAANGITVQVGGNGNTLYNLGTLTGSTAAVSLNGNNNLLVLGTRAAFPGVTVSGPGSILNGDAVSTGTGNQILLTDSGAEDSSLIGFEALTMHGQRWSLSAPLVLNGTAADTVSVESGILLLTNTVSTNGGTTIGRGGILLVGDANSRTATLTNPNGVIVNAGGILGGDGTLIGDVTNRSVISTAAPFSGGVGSFTIQGNVNNAGFIDLRSPVPGNSLLVRGNYFGSGFSRLVLNAALGGDGSVSDTLIVDGGTIGGRTGIRVLNRGGDGGKTINGIPVVLLRNGATSPADAFFLSQPAVAGLYEYRLVQNPTDQQWYLTTLGFRPEIGSYLGNIYAATHMFQHSLYDPPGHGK